MMTKAMHVREKNLLDELVLLKKLSSEMDAVNLRTYPEPTEEAKPGDTLLGVAPEDIRRFWAVYDMNCDELRETLNLAQRGELTLSDGRSVKRVHSEGMEKLEVHFRVLQDAVKVEFDVDNRPDLSGFFRIIFGKDWKIYLRKENPEALLGIASELARNVIKLQVNRATSPG